MADESHSILTPLLVAAMGILPLSLMATGSQSEAEAVKVVETPVFQDPAPQVADTAIDGPAVAPASSDVVMTIPAPTISGVTDEIARVLASEGFAAEESLDGVPKSVVTLLRERGVVLTIAVEGEN